MLEEKVLSPVYNELLKLLFMLQMSYTNGSAADSSLLKCKVDELIDYIHAHNILEDHPYIKNL